MTAMNDFDPRKQFSKWLARWSCLYWFFYMAALVAVVLVQPSVADAVVYLSIIISVVMIVHVWAYTKNSIYEKSLRIGQEMAAKGKLTWKAGNHTDKPDSQDEEAEESEGESNG